MATIKKESVKKETTAVKPVKTAVVKKVEVKEVVAPSTSAKATVDKKAETKTAVKSTLSLDVYDLAGKVSGKVSLSAEIFGDKVNKTLLAQAVRVYRANKRQGNASTKTRGEVDGSTRKIYRQKGTGKARHGSIRAPIFVKGGIVFGPKPRDYSLELPTKMKRKALFSALSAKFAAKEIKIVAGFEELKPKTKDFVTALQKLELYGEKRSILLVTGAKADSVKRASGNVPGVVSLPFNVLNAFEVIKNKNVVIMKDAIAEMEKTYLAKK